ncbi:lipopolysaccharide biosynthesis protein [Prevotella lacticifex]|uniref:lipopolysaccharide biosynthesis protein n=1 Tax=Prevotella lacticifex TaxID=2854755 RepID=UPI001CC4FE29|nr:lipopolysaccharide biosynthesis protein [Prevotella lacticifex]
MSSLKVEMAKGLMWTAIGKYTGIVISIIVSMILARLITPEEFGIVAIAQVAIAFISVISDMGIGAAIVQNKTLTKSDYDNLFTFTVILGFLLSGVVVGMSPFLAKFYHSPKLVNVCIMIAISMFFGIISMVPEALFTKNKRFAFVNKRSMVFGVIGGIISIIYAFLGGGCYALVLSPILTAIPLFIIDMKEYPCHIVWHLSLAPFKKIFSFSFFQFSFGLVNYFSRNLDKLIIGRALDMKSLGYYQKSYSLMLMPLQNITFVITPVLQSFLSDYQDDLEFIREKYLKIIKLIATISFPLGVLLYYIGYEVVYILYGSQWVPAVPTFQIFALSIPLQLILSTTGSIFQSVNHTRDLFFVGIINTATTVSGFLICTCFWREMNSFALSWDITLIFNFIVSFSWMFRCIFKHSSLEVYKELLHPLVIGIIIFIVCGFVNFFIPKEYIVITLVLKILITLIVSYFMIRLYGDYDVNAFIGKSLAKLRNLIHK